MKIKEYYRLSKLSLKDRKKSTRAAVSGLAIGFIILLPIIVCLFGINFSFNKQLNAKPYLLYYNVSKMTDYKIKMDNYEHAFVSGSENIDYFESDKKITNKIVYEIDKLTGNYDNTTKYKINGEDWRPINNLITEHFSIIDIDKSDSYFPTNLVNSFPEGIFLSRCDQGFTNNGKKQVVVAESMLKSLNLQPDDIYLKQITISTDSYKDNKNSEQPFSGFICKNYTVVGIIKEAVSKLYNNYELMNSNLFFTSVNVYGNQEGMLKPYFTVLPEISISKGGLATNGEEEYSYKNYNIKEELNEEYMMIGSYGRISFQSYLSFFTTNIYIESNSYSNLISSYNKAEKHMNEILQTNIMFPLEKSTLFTQYKFVYELIIFASSIFLIIACVIIFCAIINIYVTIKHSIKQRIFYLTMLRAIGAKNKILPRLYMMELSIIVTRASIFIMTIGFIITATIKIMIDNALTINKVNYDLSISWLSIIICISTIVIVLYVIALTFSYIGTHKLAKKPIISILNEQ